MAGSELTAIVECIRLLVFMNPLESLIVLSNEKPKRRHRFYALHSALALPISTALQATET